jgi:hypothetical protein
MFLAELNRALLALALLEGVVQERARLLVALVDLKALKEHLLVGCTGALKLLLLLRLLVLLVSGDRGFLTTATTTTAHHAGRGSNSSVTIKIKQGKSVSSIVCFHEYNQMMSEKNPTGQDSLVIQAKGFLCSLQSINQSNDDVHCHLLVRNGGTSTKGHSLGDHAPHSRKHTAGFLGLHGSRGASGGRTGRGSSRTFGGRSRTTCGTHTTTSSARTLRNNKKDAFIAVSYSLSVTVHDTTEKTPTGQDSCDLRCHPAASII